VEIIVKEESEISKAVETIEGFMRSHNLPLVEGPIHSKLLEYIYRNRQQHYQALLDCGVLNKRY